VSKWFFLRGLAAEIVQRPSDNFDYVERLVNCFEFIDIVLLIFELTCLWQPKRRDFIAALEAKGEKPGNRFGG